MAISDFVQVMDMQVQKIFTKNPKSSTKKDHSPEINNKQQKMEIQFATKFGFSDLSWVNPFHKQINKGSLTKLLRQFSSSPMS